MLSTVGGNLTKLRVTAASAATRESKMPSRNFKPFVSSRVGEIQSNTDSSQWRHIPGEVNVADDVSREIRVEELNGRWSNGPEFLQLPEEFWPQEAMKDVSEEEMERRQVKVICEVKKLEQAINPEKFSIWRKLIRVTARIQRLAKNISSRKHAQEGRNKVQIRILPRNGTQDGDSINGKSTRRSPSSV